MIWSIVVAGGKGERFGAEKQFLELAGTTVLARSVSSARAISDGVVAVVPAERVGAPQADCGADLVVAGGADRAASVRAGLAAVDERADVIVVHDAARPLASVDLFRRVVEALAGGADAVVPAVAVTDTIKRVAGSIVVETLARDELVAVQTPQAFRAEVLRAAHASGETATDDAALVERVGGKVVVVPGEPQNAKLTTPGDLTRFRSELGAGDAP